MTTDAVLPTRTMKARELRHESLKVSLDDHLTIVAGLAADGVRRLVDAIRSGSVVMVDDGGSLRPATAQDLPADAPPLVVALGVTSAPATAAPDTSAPAGGQDAPKAEADVAVAEAALADAQAVLDTAEASYTRAQDELLALRRDADRGAHAALEEAERSLDEAREAAASARRVLVAAREEAQAAEADLGEVRELRARRDHLRDQRDEMAARLSRMPNLDAARLSQALEGLRRLRQVKPRPMARAVEMADRILGIEEELTAMAVDSPPTWLSKPALDALRGARADLAALESGIPAVAVDPGKVATVQAAHAALLDAEARAMEKGNRSNRRRLEEATNAEREALHALGLSSYGQFLKYLAPTLDIGAREERVAEARAALSDTEAVWAELHGGTVPEQWTQLQVERAELVEEAHELLGGDVATELLDETLRTHLEAFVDTSWAEDALSQALAATGMPLPPGGLEAAAEKILADAPELAEEREQISAAVSQLDAELEVVDANLAELAPPVPDEAGAGDNSTPSLREVEEAVQAAESRLRDAEAAVAETQERVQKADSVASTEAKAAAAAESTKADVQTARDALAQAHDALTAAAGAAADAVKAIADAATAAADRSAAAAVARRYETRLRLLARSVAHHATGTPMIVTGDPAALGEPADVVAMLAAVAGDLQVIAVFADATVAEAASALGDRGRIVRV